MSEIVLGGGGGMDINGGMHISSGSNASKDDKVEVAAGVGAVDSADSDEEFAWL